MNPVVVRIGELLRLQGQPEPSDPARTLTIDLAIAVVGFALFGGSIAVGNDPLWHGTVALKVAGSFMTAFVLSLPPLFAIKRFFAVEARFAEIVSGFARHLALGGIFTAASAGPFLLMRNGEANHDGWLAVAFVGAAIVCVLVSSLRMRAAWLAPIPALLAVSLFLSLLTQSAWAYRPYMDPKSPTLFQAKMEWFAGEKREWLEEVVIELGGR